MIKHLGHPSLRKFLSFRFQHSLQRFSNARVDATLAVIFLVAFQIVCLCSLILTSIHCVSQSYRFLFFLQMVKSYIGSLHTPEVIEKFRKLGASQEVLLVLQQGLFMPYEESLIPKNEFFTHNKSYFENREFANQQLKIWELKG